MPFLETQFVPDLITVLASLISISITFAVITYFVYFPAKKSIQERQSFIKNNIDNSIEKNQQADQFLNESESKIKQALEDSDIIISTSKTEADLIKQKIIEDTNQEINDLKVRLEKNNNLLLEKQKEEFNDQVISLAIEISKRIIDEKISDEEEIKLIDKFTKELENESNK